MVLSNTRSQLRHRPINKVPVTPQQGVPLRARSTRAWQADNQQEAIKTVSTNVAWSQGDEQSIVTAQSEQHACTSFSPVPIMLSSAPDDQDTNTLLSEEGGEEMDTITHPSTRAVTQRPSYLPVRSNTVVKADATGTRQHMTDTRTTTNSKYDKTEPLSSAKVTHSLNNDRATSASGYRQASPHWSLFIGLGMVLLIVLYVLGFTVLVTCEDIYNDWTYGNVRTTQLDAVVGDHDSRQHPSHFIALNLHRHIEIIEFPGGDATHASVFIGPQLTWANADKAYITVKVLDVNHDGKLDLDITITGDPVMFFSTPTFHYDLIRTKKSFVYQQG